MKLHIKYIVSLRCKLIVKYELEKLGCQTLNIDLGIAEILDDLTNEQLKNLNDALKRCGLELLDDKRSILIEEIKTIVIELIHYNDEEPVENYSEVISSKLGHNYNYLSNIFSEVKGITIQQFIILNKIEKIKELMLYDTLSLTEIAYKMHYSSIAHLSNQFKKVTGMSPSFFRQLKKKRINLENL